MSFEKSLFALAIHLFERGSIYIFKPLTPLDARSVVVRELLHNCILTGIAYPHPSSLTCFGEVPLPLQDEVRRSEMANVLVCGRDHKIQLLRFIPPHSNNSPIFQWHLHATSGVIDRIPSATPRAGHVSPCFLTCPHVSPCCLMLPLIASCFLLDAGCLRLLSSFLFLPRVRSLRSATDSTAHCLCACGERVSRVRVGIGLRSIPSPYPCWLHRLHVIWGYQGIRASGLVLLLLVDGVLLLPFYVIPARTLLVPCLPFLLSKSLAFGFLYRPILVENLSLLHLSSLVSRLSPWKSRRFLSLAFRKFGSSLHTRSWAAFSTS